MIGDLGENPCEPCLWIDAIELGGFDQGECDGHGFATPLSGGIHTINAAQELESKGVSLRSLREDIDTTTPLGRIFYSICAIFAQFERDLISDRTKTGLAAAKAAGRRGGRPKAMDSDMRNVIEQKLVGTSLSISAIAKEHGISPSTIYNVFPGGRSALVAKRFKVLSDFTIGSDRFQVVEDSVSGEFYWRLAGDTPEQITAPYGPFPTAQDAAGALGQITGGRPTKVSESMR